MIVRAFRISPLALSGVALLLIAPGAALMVLPALALVIALLLGCFPGEPAIHRLRRRRTGGERHRRVREVAVHRRAPIVLRPMGSALLAFHRACRPPPVAVAVA